MAQRPIIQTQNFRHNAEELEAFCETLGTPERHRAMLSELKTTVLPNLRRFPSMGRPFLQREPYSIEALNELTKLLEQLALCPKDTVIREYVLADHLLLYAATTDTVYLLSIRHHKQLSFDFLSFWTP